jgi:selenocysteine-specific translation elongation factor
MGETEPTLDQQQVCDLIKACDKITESLVLQNNEVQEIKAALILLAEEFNVEAFRYLIDRLFKVSKKEGIKIPKTRLIGFNR